MGQLCYRLSAVRDEEATVTGGQMGCPAALHWYHIEAHFPVMPCHATPYCAVLSYVVLRSALWR